MEADQNSSSKALRQLRKLTLICAALGLLLQGCGRTLDPEASCNFVQNENLQRVSWHQQTVPIYIHDSVPLEYSQAIQAAVNEWNSAFTNQVIELRGRVSGSETPARDGYNIIYYFNTWEQDRGNEQARTTIYWAGDRIYESDIRLNGTYNLHAGESNPAGGEIDLQSLLIHELGHFLGLAHVPNTNTSVMHAQLANGKVRRNLSDGDLSSLSCEYGI